MIKDLDYAALFQASPYPYLLISPDFTLVGANAAYLKATGTTADTLLGKKIFDAFPANPADPASTNLDEVRKSIELAVATHQPHTSPLLRYAIPLSTLEHGPFETRLWSAVHTPVIDTHGEVVFIAQTAIDVTDLYRFDKPKNRYFLKESVQTVPDIAERTRLQLHEALTRVLNAERTELQTLFDQAPGFIAVLSEANHVFMMVNDAFYHLVGRRNLIGNSLWEALPELVGQGLEPILDEVARSGKPIVLHDRRLTLRGEQDGAQAERYVDLVFQPVLDADGTVSAVFAQGHDVTGAYLASAALKEKVRELEAAKARQTVLLKLGERLRSLSDNPDAMMLAASEELAAFLGVPRTGYVTFEKNSNRAVVITTYADPDRVPPLSAIVAEPDEYGQSVMNELRSGRHIVVHDMDTDPRTAGAVAQAHAAIGARASLAVPIRRQDQSVGFMFAHDDQPRQWLDEDIELMYQTTDRTWEAVERAHALLAMREADRRKDEFLAMLAHELRNPLAPIGAAAQLLQVIKPDEARLRQTSEVISRQVRHMTALIDDLLDVSRVTSGRIKLHTALLEVRDIVVEAVEQVQPLITSRKQNLTLDLAQQATLVEGDRKRLVQVVGNILGNAAKYTHDRGHLVVRTSVVEGNVVIEVRDNGIGMTAALSMRVFDLFSQAERTSDRTSGGLGLGLALVKSLVELHGGSVTCASEGAGNGSTFRVQLPHVPDSLQAGEEPMPDRYPHKAPAALRILVVDDNTDAADMLGMLLDAMGYEVQLAYSSLRALECAKECKPDVCLLDIGLPDIDGNELARRLRDLPQTRHARLIAVTGYSQHSDKENTSAAGFAHHLVKPVDIDRLAAILKDIAAV
ncbi:hypothetical protein CR152_26075 [Massilia violaceinigra]|uniref:histidine kinase n=1 Tax=Massilia violaceinigra TaxID=2045208 RepID=A0A2D2DRH8_9BURK|nr:ATP-binding protein [Massilia violaceinigra]ATQ77582.1 hypothetical protein CR152_26075 [Massilia violaceinigra]